MNIILWYILIVFQLFNKLFVQKMSEISEKRQSKWHLSPKPEDVEFVIKSLAFLLKRLKQLIY